MGLLRGLREELDVASLAEGHDGLLPVAAFGDALAHALHLAALDEGVDASDFDVEQLLDRVLDLELVGGDGHLEDDLIALHLQARGLLGERDRTPDDLFRGEDHDFSPLQRASRAFAACFDTTRWSWRRRSYTLTPSGGRN